MPRNPLQAAEASLRKYALTFPGAYEDFPWGERVVKVAKKIFLFVNIHKGILHATVKLPESGRSALTLPFCAPTGYGLGKSGWVSAAFEAGDAVPVDLLQEWIGESYQAIAPAKLLDGKAVAKPNVMRKMPKKRTSTSRAKS